MGRFVTADGYASTGQGLLGNNMYSYCNNNPFSYCDPNGESLLGAIIGGTIGGALISTVSYIVNSGLSGQEVTGEGLINAALTGGISGAVGGAIGTITLASNGMTTVVKGIASVGVGVAVDIKSGMETEGSGFKRWATGISTGLIAAGSTFVGSLIDTSGLGFAGTAFANFATATFVGTPAEMVTVTVQQGINAIDKRLPAPNPVPSSSPRNPSFSNKFAVAMVY